ncbi:MAG: YARHG domain-containing protein [Verrucomicrobia bacterium]|nr:YARHG domain-containing protein [Verrucomicrobiota bacterium]
MRIFLFSVLLTAGLAVFPSLGLESETDEFSFETRPDKDGPRSSLWIWPAGHKEEAVSQKLGESAEFSPNHAWMVLTERIDQPGNQNDRDYRLHLARRVNDSVYKYDRKTDAELENKVLSFVLSLYGYQRSDCQRYTILPCRQWAADSHAIAVVANIQVTDPKDKEFFERIDGWKGIYNLDNAEVFQVLDPGKISAASSKTALTFLEIRPPENGERTDTIWRWQGDRQEEAVELNSFFNVSSGSSWLVINNHLSTGGYLEFGRQKEGSVYILDGDLSDQNDDGIASVAFKQNGLNVEDYLGDHYSYSFEGWDDVPDRILVGFNSELSVRDKDRNFLHLTGWIAVYDLKQHKIVAQLNSGTVAEAFAGERFPETRQRVLTKADIQNWSHAQLRYAINETYARHGATFRDQAIEKLFKQFAWYKPHSDRSIEQIEDSLSESEKQNIDLLRQLQDSKGKMH